MMRNRNTIYKIFKKKNITQVHMFTAQHQYFPTSYHRLGHPPMGKHHLFSIQKRSLMCTLDHSPKSQGITHILNFPQELDNKRKKAHPLKNFDVNFAPQIQTGSPTSARGDVKTIFSQLLKMHRPLQFY